MFKLSSPINYLTALSLLIVLKSNIKIKDTKQFKRWPRKGYSSTDYLDLKVNCTLMFQFCLHFHVNNLNVYETMYSMLPYLLNRNVGLTIFESWPTSKNERCPLSYTEGGIVLASRASFGHPKPSKITPRETKNLWELFLKISISNTKLNFFHLHIIPMTLCKDLMPNVNE